MKKVMLLFSILFFFSISIVAQANKNYDGVKPEVYKGAKSIVFSYIPFQSDLGSVPTSNLQIYDGSSITATEVGGIGLKYFITDKISLLGSFGFGSNVSTFEGEYSSTEVSITSLALSIDADYHLPSLYNISTYFGANINVGSYSMKIDYASSTTEASSSCFGIGANIGFDWYFAEGLSLGGKYTLELRHYSEPEYGDESGPSSTVLGTGIGTIILNVHF